MQGIWTPQPFSFPQRHEGWFALGSRLCTLINSPPSESLHTPPVPFTLDPWPLGNNSADQTVANPKTQLYWAVVFSWGFHSDGGLGLMYGTTWLSVFGSCCNTYLEAEYKCKLGSWSYEIAPPKVKAKQGTLELCRQFFSKTCSHHQFHFVSSLNFKVNIDKFSRLWYSADLTETRCQAHWERYVKWKQ